MRGGTNAKAKRKQKKQPTKKSCQVTLNSIKTFGERKALIRALKSRGKPGERRKGEREGKESNLLGRA